MSSSRAPTHQSSSASSTRGSRTSARIVAQTTVDARLDAEFEEHGSSFDYSRTVTLHKAANAGTSPAFRSGSSRSDKVTAYLQHIQKGKLIQPFGCLVAIDEHTMRVIALSENAPEMLASSPHAVPSSGSDHPSLSLGSDLRSFLTSPSAAALLKASSFPDVSPLNPVLVHSRSSGRPFYAILHRVTGCLVADFEPVKPSELPSSAAGALQSYKLAAKAISKLQSLPGGSMQRLCDTVVQEVFELTGYDRVMAYKFHDDDHGEVVAEVTKPGLEPYLGLHYPATDIPQAARFLFMKNKVRMICDCRAKPAKVFQDESLPVDLTFCGSTLRSPHSCHLQYMENMNSIASLVMAVVVNDDDDGDTTTGEDGPSPSQQKTRKRLWGLVVCHHTSPRFVPFPLRYACEFLAQVFAVHVNKEFELENQVREKNILRTQTLLCDMLLRDAPLGIIMQTPNIMDLVRCDGAALLYQNRLWTLGTTPTEHQIRMIADWLQEYHVDSTGLSTDSLMDAGFPGARSLGDAVCGMAAARISMGDMLFWFRSHVAAEIRWGGAKHEPGEKDDGRRMHPRSSFKAFLEVVNKRSSPWKDYEMDAIHSLQLILRGAFDKTVEVGKRAGQQQRGIDERVGDLRLDGMAELQAVTDEMVRLIETANVPILAVDMHGLINGWNIKIAELTGLSVKHAIGRHLMHLVEDSSTEIVETMLQRALKGQEEQNVEFQLKTHGAKIDEGPVTLVVNACASRDIHENVVGVCFVAQDITSHKQAMDKFMRIEGDYKAIVQNPSPLIPPIFGADEFGWCSEWNPAMTKLTGWKRDDVIDRMLLGEVFGTHMACCRMKNQEALVNLSVLINNAMTGQAAEQVPFGFFSRKGKHIECLLSVSMKADADGIITGVFCFLHIASHELQQLLHVQRLSEQSAAKKLKALSYIRHEIRCPLSGIMYTRQRLNGTELNGEQRQLLDTGAKCHNLVNKILDDLDIDNIMASCLELEMVEFSLRGVLLTAMSQVMIPSSGKGIRIVQDLDDDILDENLYGDSLRLQQIIGDFLLISVRFASSGSMVEVGGSLSKDRLGSSLQVANLELRITHTGVRVPEDLLSQMFGSEEEATEEGISLLVCRKVLRLMNGNVLYVREATKSSFIISAELASAKVKSARMRS